MMRCKWVVLAALLASSCGGTNPEAPEEQALAAAAPIAVTEVIRGAGSSFVYPAMRLWAAQYRDTHGVAVYYDPIGSGGGVTRLSAKTVDFAASEKPLTQVELDAGGYTQWPILVGAIVPAVNLHGVKAGDLVFDGPTLADIFLGKILHWNSPRIRRLNPDVNLPSSTITLVHRSEDSGTTYNLTDYFSKVSPAWRKQVGAASTVNWPGGIGGIGNAGVAQHVRRIPNSIGYVTFAYAVESALAYTRMINSSGTAVEPNIESFRSAAKDADHLALLTNRPGENSWPILATTFVLMPHEAHSAAQGFFHWCFGDGAAVAEKLDYITLPDPTQ